MIKRILRHLGYYRCDYGYSSGRHWIEIDKKLIAQTGDADVYLRDEDVHRIGYAVLDHEKHWTKSHDITNY